jgi:hypothetical protein
MKHRVRKLRPAALLVAALVLTAAFIPWQAAAQKAQSRDRSVKEVLATLGIEPLPVPGLYEELNFTPDQMAAMTALAKRTQDPADGLNGLQDIWTSAQHARHRQLMHQFYGPLYLSDPKEATAIGIPDATRDGIEDLSARHIDLLNAQQEEYERAEASQKRKLLEKQLIARRKNFDESSAKALAMLSPQALARWKTMIGKPFEFKLPLNEEDAQYAFR